MGPPPGRVQVRVWSVQAFSGQGALGWPQGGLQKDRGDRRRKAQKPNGTKAVKTQAIAMGSQAHGLRCLVVLVVVVVVLRCV